jgi:uncharacterized protein (UPF0332 family)
MRRPVEPDELIRLAYHLADDAKLGQLGTVWLRRAISSAYYALFHELVSGSATQVLPADAGRDEARWTITRWYQHGDVRQVSEWVSALASDGRGAPEPITALFGGSAAPEQIPADLLFVAESFIILHGARQRADYDHALEVTRELAVALVDRAAGAISTWREMPGGYHVDLFRMLLLGGPRLARAR